MNSSWKKLFKTPPTTPGLLCNFCNLKFNNPGALATHKKFAHHHEMHPEKATSIEKMFSTLPPSPSKPTKQQTKVPPIEKSSSHKRRIRRTNNQKLKLILGWENLREGEKSRFLLRNCLTRSMMRRYVLQKEEIIRACKKKHRCVTAAPPTIKFGFPEQREKLYQEILSRRKLGLVVDCEFIQTRFKQILRADKPPGWKKAKASPRWRTSFLEQYELTSQLKTNKKSKSIEERLPKVKRFHQYTVYGAAYVLPSIYK